ncbi:MAG: hypothetical protein A3J75_08665 [Acidobacteria bacterium RBG_16_68_9]|nr:MAG: hypothetical protein A3J75_08665 [Acidobacteria bacterium RBG_16_68_9]
MSYNRRIILLLMLALGAPSLASGQPPRFEQRDRARTFLVLRLTEELNLSDEKALQVSRLVRESDEQRRKLRAQRQEVEEKLRTALAAPSPDSGELQKLIAQANDIDEQLAMLPERTIREVQKSLTVEQQARLVLFRPELQSQVRRAIRKRVRERLWEHAP